MPGEEKHTLSVIFRVGDSSEGALGLDLGHGDDIIPLGVAGVGPHLLGVELVDEGGDLGPAALLGLNVVLGGLAVPLVVDGLTSGPVNPATGGAGTVPAGTEAVAGAAEVGEAVELSAVGAVLVEGQVAEVASVAVAAPLEGLGAGELAEGDEGRAGGVGDLFPELLLGLLGEQGLRDAGPHVIAVLVGQQLGRGHALGPYRLVLLLERVRRPE